MISKEAWTEYIDEATDFHATFKSWSELQKYVVHAARLEQLAIRMMDNVRAIHTISQLTARGCRVDVLSTGQGIDEEAELVKPIRIDDLGFLLFRHPAYMGCAAGKKKISEVGRKNPANNFGFKMPEGKSIVTGNDYYDWKGFVTVDVFKIPIEGGLDVVEFCDPELQPRFLVCTGDVETGPFTFEVLETNEILEMIQGGLPNDEYLIQIDEYNDPVNDSASDIPGSIAVKKFTGNYTTFYADDSVPGIPINETHYVYDSALAGITDSTVQLDLYADADLDATDLMADFCNEDDSFF